MTGFGQQLLDDALGLVIIALPEVVITNSSFPIDEVNRWPPFLVDRLPDAVLAVHRDWVSDLQNRAWCFLRSLVLERELRRMHADHNQASIRRFRRPGLHIGQLSQAVDAGLG